MEVMLHIAKLKMEIPQE